MGHDYRNVGQAVVNGKETGYVVWECSKCFVRVKSSEWGVISKPGANVPVQTVDSGYKNETCEQIASRRAAKDLGAVEEVGILPAEVVEVP
jgi:hypothetical protein